MKTVKLNDQQIRDLIQLLESNIEDLESEYAAPLQEILDQVNAAEEEG
jgi:hypothetical protein